jgi:hypothetical protein
MAVNKWQSCMSILMSFIYVCLLSTNDYQLDAVFSLVFYVFVVFKLIFLSKFFVEYICFSFSLNYSSFQHNLHF